MFDDALTRRAGVSCDFRIVRDDGVLRSLSCTGRVVLGAGGKPLRFVGVTQDVTDRRELQDRLTVSDRLASVGTLAGGIAHEINNPLAYVITNLEVLTHELKRTASAQPAPAIAPLLEMLSEARNGAERVRRIVRDLKVFARVRDDGEGTADLHDVVQLSINMAAHEVRQRARLVRDLQPVPRVRGNEGRLGQVVLNLIVNAAHAIPGGDTGANEIHVRTCTDAAGRVVVEVRDTGCGMSPDLLSHIFDPFFSTKPIGHGMGLGLSISHGIVHAAGGSIEVESETGKGSVFRVILLPSGEPVAAPGPVAAASPKSISPAKPRRGRVLIVDDEPMIRTSLRRFLGADHDVDATSEGAQVLKALAAGIHYDLILCDLLMPAMTGMDIYDAVRRDHPDQVGSFVFMSGGAFTGRAESFLEEIPNTVLDKPIDVVALRAIIEERLAPRPQPVAEAC
jgi:signal transduction histidine kinase/CheY-like chemotaxis protein